jgi:L-ascorbate metabolism protein UlaG (beta-lactamase superfamily)
MQFHHGEKGVKLTLIGGPTVLIELDGLRLLTDPTFDDPGDYSLAHVTLRKTGGPAIRADAVASVDAVPLSHDQHADNLDNAGRRFLSKAGKVFTTIASVTRLVPMRWGLRLGKRRS